MKSLVCTRALSNRSPVTRHTHLHYTIFTYDIIHLCMRYAHTRGTCKVQLLEKEGRVLGVCVSYTRRELHNCRAIYLVEILLGEANESLTVSKHTQYSVEIFLEHLVETRKKENLSSFHAQYIT